MTRDSAFVSEVANELSTWPGVSVGRRADAAAVISYGRVQLGLLYPNREAAEIHFLDAEHDQLIEEGDAEPAETTDNSTGVGHSLRGPSDVTAVLELFDRRYREVRGDDGPYVSSDPE
jgi:hypothetical protein